MNVHSANRSAGKSRAARAGKPVAAAGSSGEKRGRGRPIVDDKRRLILDAALRVFAVKGYHGTVVPEVAEAAGVGTGTLYRYFANKEALVNEVYRDAKQKLRVALLEGVREPGGDGGRQARGEGGRGEGGHGEGGHGEGGRGEGGHGERGEGGRDARGREARGREGGRGVGGRERREAADDGDRDGEADAQRWFYELWRRLGVFARAEPEAFRFLEMQDHVEYLDLKSRQLELSVLMPLWMAGKKLATPYRELAAPVDTLIALLWGAFVGLVKASRLGYLSLDEKRLQQAGEACWRMLAPAKKQKRSRSRSRTS